MGGGNPIKRVVSGVKDAVKGPVDEIIHGNPIKGALHGLTNAAMEPVSAGLDAVGLQGAANISRGINAGVNNLESGIFDAASGRTTRLKEEAAAAGARASSIANAKIETKKKQEAAAADAAMNAERMAAGNRARTLLTGGLGLEDENSTVSRRKLSGR